MNICNSQLILEVFIFTLNISLLYININYNQNSLKYKDYFYRILIAFIPVVVSEMYIMLYFKAFIILPLNIYTLVLVIILISSVQISKALMSLMLVCFILINPVLIITDIIELTVQCGDKYTDNHDKYIYIISVTVVIISILIGLLTIIIITSVKSLTEKYNDIAHRVYLDTFTEGYEQILSDPKEQEIVISELEGINIQTKSNDIVNDKNDFIVL